MQTAMNRSQIEISILACTLDDKLLTNKMHFNSGCNYPCAGKQTTIQEFPSLIMKVKKRCLNRQLYRNFFL